MFVYHFKCCCTIKLVLFCRGVKIDNLHTCFCLWHCMSCFRKMKRKFKKKKKEQILISTSAKLRGSINLETCMLSSYWSQDVGASLPELCEWVSGLHTSCRQLKEDEPCWRPPAAGRTPSLNCRWYGWKRSESTWPPRVPSVLCLLFTAAGLKLKVFLSRRVKQTFLPSVVCGVIQVIQYCYRWRSPLVNGKSQGWILYTFSLN